MWSGRLTFTIAVVVVAAIAVACGDGESAPANPSPAPGGEETQASSPTPVLGDKERHVPERTGTAELDAIIDGFMLHDTKTLLPHLRYSVLPCGVEPGIGGSPPCRADQETGTPVEVMPLSACEFGYYRPHEFELLLPQFAEQDIYGVYQATPEVRFPGDYVIVLTQPQADDPAKGMATDVIVKDGRIVGVDFSCVLTPEEAVELHELTEPLFLPDGTDEAPDTTY